MNTIKSLNPKRIYKTIFSSLAAIMLVFCAVFAFVGCGNDDYTVPDATSIAHKRFGCEKILWVCSVHGNSNVANSDLPNEGGYCIVGLDNDGNEVYLVVPKFENKYYKAALFEWKFNYTFAQIAAVFSKYGYKYADGIDGREKEYISNRYSTHISVQDREDGIKQQLAVFGDADDLYEKLDVKLILEFFCKSNDGEQSYYFLTQSGGELVVYEMADGNFQSFSVTIYNKDYI